MLREPRYANNVTRTVLRELCYASHVTQAVLHESSAVQLSAPSVDGCLKYMQCVLLSGSSYVPLGMFVLFLVSPISK